jgi:tetratricopeptide (TPR) repeat protein
MMLNCENKANRVDLSACLRTKSLKQPPVMSGSNERPQEPENSTAGDSSAENLWAMLDALRRKLDDNANIGRKTQHAMVQLADSLAAQVTASRRRTKWLNINSFGAYVIFTLLLGSGVYFLYRIRTDGLISENAMLVREQRSQGSEIAILQAQLAGRTGATDKVWAAYELLRANDQQAAAVAKMKEIGTLPLGAVSKTELAILTELQQRAQAAVTEADYRAGLAAYRAGKFADAVVRLQAGLGTEPTGSRAGQMYFFVGMSQLKLHQSDSAVTAFEQALENDFTTDDIRYYYATALDAKGAMDQARAEYERYAAKTADSLLTRTAQRRAWLISRTPKVP